MRNAIAGLVIVALLLVICSSGCIDFLPFQPTETEPPITSQPFPPTPFPTILPRVGPSGTTWYLLSIERGNISENIIDGTSITAFFDGLHTVSGTAGCNEYKATYSINQTGMGIGRPEATKKVCDVIPGIMEQENLYLATIQEGVAYTVTNNLLTIRDSQGKNILTYTSVPQGTPVNPPLLGTSWYLESYVDSSGITWTPGRLTVVSLVLADNGNAYGTTGCNDYLGLYEVTGESITISDIKKTTMSCGIAGVMEVEEAYLIILPQMSTYSFSGGNLHLKDPRTGMSLIFDLKPNLP